jgi:hypothetical protein
MKNETTMREFLGKAAELHEHKAAVHKAAAESHRKMAEAARTAHNATADKVTKAFYKTNFEHHGAKAAHHEELHKAHSGMADACKAAAFDIGSSNEAKVEAPAGMQKNSVVEEFWQQFRATAPLRGYGELLK